jgi:hypothetical protein
MDSVVQSFMGWIKLVDRLPSFQECFLDEIPSIMLIAHHTVDHGEDLAAVLG